LREHQKKALISYLLVQQDLIDWGVVDGDSLFEFLLIDVQITMLISAAITGRMSLWASSPRSEAGDRPVRSW
jgi:hypothetical protein